MTAHELAMMEAREILADERCNCGAVPGIHYEAGVTWIKCERCQAQVAAPDADIQTALQLWAKLT